MDMKYPIATQLDSLYEYMYRSLLEANIRKDAQKLEEVLGFIRDLRDTWKDAMKLANAPKVAL
mgnify:CR=1 FL=1